MIFFSTICIMKYEINMYNENKGQGYLTPQNLYLSPLTPIKQGQVFLVSWRHGRLASQATD